MTRKTRTPRSPAAAQPATPATPPARQRAPRAQAAKTAVPAAAPAAKPAKKQAKPRPVLVRDSFTMPEADFALIATLKARALAGQRAAKKSELLRAGLHALAALDSPSLLAALDQLEPVKIGRPAKAP